MSLITVIGREKLSTKIERYTQKLPQVPMFKIKARGKVKKPIK